MSDYRPYNPSTDPARNKAGYLGGKNPGYPGQVGAYNNWLYTPMDRRPSVVPTASPVAVNGSSITSPYGTASVSYKPQAPAYGGVPFDYSSIIAQNSQNGINLGPQPPSSTGQNSIAPMDGPYYDSRKPNRVMNADGTPNLDLSADAVAKSRGQSSGTMTGLTPTVPSTGDATMQPGQNAMQRWQSQSQQGGGIRPLSDQRRYFWSTGSIDARAPMADPTQNKGATQPVTFNNSPSGWAPF